MTIDTISNAMSCQKILPTNLAGDNCDFRVWLPSAKTVTLRLINDQGTHDWPMQSSDGFFTLQASARAGDKYFYILDQNQPIPDPVSRLLPEGVQGPTEIVDPFAWTDARGAACRCATTSFTNCTSAHSRPKEPSTA